LRKKGNRYALNRVEFYQGLKDSTLISTYETFETGKLGAEISVRQEDDDMRRECLKLSGNDQERVSSSLSGSPRDRDDDPAAAVGVWLGFPARNSPFNTGARTVRSRRDTTYADSPTDAVEIESLSALREVLTLDIFDTRIPRQIRTSDLTVDPDESAPARRAVSLRVTGAHSKMIGWCRRIEDQFIN